MRFVCQKAVVRPKMDNLARGARSPTYKRNAHLLWLVHKLDETVAYAKNPLLIISYALLVKIVSEVTGLVQNVSGRAVYAIFLLHAGPAVPRMRAT